MYSVEWDYKAWEQYKNLLISDVKTVRKINVLISELYKNPLQGLGKPERLKYQGNIAVYSRRINKKDRLVYILDGNIIKIVSCAYHYGDK